LIFLDALRGQVGGVGAHVAHHSIPEGEDRHLGVCAGGHDICGSPEMAIVAHAHGGLT
jgi:hypothetical protein